jgi:hypothetical protein
LLAQGLRADNEKFGLRGESPSRVNFEERVERMGLVLGAIAFHMLANGVEGIGLRTLNREVGPKLERMGHGTAAAFVDDLDLLCRMNNHTLEFMLFDNDIGTGELVWDNRTVRAFFAAYWATRHASFDDDLPKLKDWIIDKDGQRLIAFDEFWQFAAEMPDRALRKGNKLSEEDMGTWMHIFRPCYTPPAKLKGKHEWVQWHRRMVFFTFDGMRKRSPAAIEKWRKRTRRQAAIVAEIEGGWRDIAAGPCHYQAEPAENRRGTVIQVPGFRMHQWPVINRWYEAFDPSHRANRWNYIGNKHPLVKVTGREGEEYCPVVSVTWYDAWNFAAWIGDHVFLPSEVQWEHACRKETSWDYYFEGGARPSWRNMHGFKKAAKLTLGRCLRRGRRSTVILTVFMTCWVTCVSGARTGMTRRFRIACTAAGAGSTVPGCAGPRPAAGARPPAGAARGSRVTITAVSVLQQFLRWSRAKKARENALTGAW